MTFDEREEFMDARLLNLRLQAERRTVQPDHDLMLWAHDEIERLWLAFHTAHGALLCIGGTDSNWSAYARNVANEAGSIALNEAKSAPEGDNDPNGNRELAREIDG